MAKRKRRIQTNLRKSDIRRYFSGAYHYSIQKNNIVKGTSRKQPIIKKISKNNFAIISPFQMFNKPIAFLFSTRLTLEGNSHYVLISTITSQDRVNYIKAIKKQCPEMYHKWLSYLKHLLIKYQVSTLKNGTFYIRIEDYSIQDAYYRLLMFEIAYSHVIKFMLWK